MANNKKNIHVVKPARAAAKGNDSMSTPTQLSEGLLDGMRTEKKLPLPTWTCSGSYVLCQDVTLYVWEAEENPTLVTGHVIITSPEFELEGDVTKDQINTLLTLPDVIRIILKHETYADELKHRAKSREIRTRGVKALRAARKNVLLTLDEMVDAWIVSFREITAYDLEEMTNVTRPK
ncbi:MAG: hypothetical protein ACR2JB_04045 [Bryobacteraceae bacterium]